MPVVTLPEVILIHIIESLRRKNYHHPHLEDKPKLLVNMPDNENEHEIKKLDNEFDNLVKQLKELIQNSGFREKFLITEWLKKLKQSNASVEERILRNRFITYFVNNQEACANVFCSDPFNKIPSGFSGTLKDLKKLLPKDPDEALYPTEDEKRLYIAELFESLPDKGAFLARQPVPRNGSFVILHFKQEDAHSDNF